MSWFDDMRGKVIRSSDFIFPSRKYLRFSGDGVTVTDNSAEDTTEVALVPFNEEAVVTSVFGRSGDVRAALGDYAASLVSYDPSGSDLTATDVQGAITEAYVDLNDRLVAIRDTFVIKTITANHQFVEDDLGKVLQCSNSGDITITIDDGSEVWPEGAILRVFRSGQGRVAFVGGSGTVINTPPGFNAEIGTRYGQVTLLRTAVGTWNITGVLHYPVDYWGGRLAPSVTSPASGTTPYSLAEDSSTDGITLTGGNSLVISRPGLYTVDCTTRTEKDGGSATNDVIGNSIYVDGVQLTRNAITTPAGISLISLCLHAVVDASAGTIIDIRNTSSFTQRTSGNTTLNYFAVNRIGDSPTSTMS